MIFKNVGVMCMLGVLTFFSNVSFAKGYKHLVEGGFELSSLKVKGAGGGSSTATNLDLHINYWHRYSSKLYIVGNLKLIDADFGLDRHLFAGGVAYNMASNPRGNFEIGPGGKFGLVSYEDDDGFMFAPYLFVRNYLDGTKAFLTFELAYEFAFMDDIDYRGFVSTISLGLAL